jgi:hypothetical protein
MRRFFLIVVLSLAPACVTRGELAADVGAWRAYYDATRPDLERLYEAMPEPSRTTRLKLVAEQADAIAAAESRSK